MKKRPCLLPGPLALAPALLLFACGFAHAVRGADVPPPTAQAVRAANPRSADGAVRSEASATAQALGNGRVTAVDATAGRVEIDGNWYRLVEGRTRIYRRGALLAASALAAGQQVAYALDKPANGATAAAAPNRDALAVVHVR